MDKKTKGDFADMKRLEAAIGKGLSKRAALNEVEGGPKQEMTLPKPSK